MNDDSTEPIRLANLTVIDHSPHLERYAAQGYRVDGAPGGLVVPTGLDWRAVRAMARDTVERVARAGYHGALIGGRADVVCYLRDALVDAGLRCFAADTALSLDREGYFIPLPIGLVEIVAASGHAT